MYCTLKTRVVIFDLNIVFTCDISLNLRTISVFRFWFQSCRIILYSSFVRIFGRVSFASKIYTRSTSRWRYRDLGTFTFGRGVPNRAESVDHGLLAVHSQPERRVYTTPHTPCIPGTVLRTHRVCFTRSSSYLRAGDIPDLNTIPSATRCARGHHSRPRRSTHTHPEAYLNIIFWGRGLDICFRVQLPKSKGT